MHDVALRWAELMEQGDSPYDAFLDEYEPGMTTAEVKAVFDVLQPELTAIVSGAGEPADDAFLEGDFPVATQEEFLAGILRDFGFEEGSYRLDPTVHPFATSFSGTDIRMTTRYKPDNLRALWAGCTRPATGCPFRASIPRSAAHRLRKCLARPRRVAEPHLGEPRRPLDSLLARPLSRAAATLPQLQAVELDDFFRGINRVAPGLIRVDADEVTYSLHIILRFELEQELVAGTLALEDLPEAWNARMKAFLGIDVPDDARGVLQDVHWTRASYGYFPTYALGNVLSVQIWRAVQEEIPDLDEQLEAGEFAPLYESLRTRLYRHGRKFTPMETLERAIGTNRIDPQPYLEYLQAKAAGLHPPRPVRTRHVSPRPVRGLSQTRPAQRVRVQILCDELCTAAASATAQSVHSTSVEDVLGRSQALVESFEAVVRAELPKDSRSSTLTSISGPTSTGRSATSTSSSPFRSATVSPGRSCSASTSPTDAPPSAPPTTGRSPLRHAPTAGSCRLSDST